MKDAIRVGLKWLNPANIVMIEADTAEPPNVKVITNAHPPAKNVWDFAGDEAEAVLREVGHDKAGRAARKEAEARAEREKEEEIAEIHKKHAAAVAKAEEEAREKASKAGSHAHKGKAEKA